MDYHGILQKAIDYIEDHLHEPLTLESVASYAGFSKYHFHRVFQKETGMTVSDDVRLRRLASAASMLQPKMKGWFLSGSHPFHYEMGTDTKEVHQGKRSGYLKSVTVQSADCKGYPLEPVLYRSGCPRQQRLDLLWRPARWKGTGLGGSISI